MKSEIKSENMYFTQPLNSKACFGGPRSFWNTPTKALFIKMDIIPILPIEMQKDYKAFL